MRFDTIAALAATRRLSKGLWRHAGRMVGLRSRALVGTAIVTISAGVVASMIASVVLGPYGDQVLARNGDANRGFLDVGGGEAVPSAAPLPAPQWTKNVSRPHGAQASREGGRRRWASSRRAATHLATARPTGRHSVCVRLCDGFFYPVGDVHDSSDLDTQTAVCANSCPGAPTRLFVVPSDERDMSKAAAIPDGKPYTALPVAFAHAKEVGPTCACHAAGEGEAALMTPLRDITMRDGDSVMTKAGWRVFKGDGHWPYKAANFTTLDAARNMPAQTRVTLAALQDASLGRTAIAVATPAVLDIHKHRRSLGLKGTDSRDAGLSAANAPVFR